MLGLLLSVRIVGKEAFANYAVALALQALCFTVASAVGPLCGRGLAADPRREGDCLRWRLRAGTASGALLAMSGGIMELSGHSALGTGAWFALSLQLPLSSLEAHRLQVLQMHGRFRDLSIYQPLSRVAKACAMGMGWAFGLQGAFPAILVQTMGQMLASIPCWKARSLPNPDPPVGFDRSSWAWNALSGAVVWSSTRANLLVSASRLGSGQTALYGLAETLSSSLSLLNQSLMTLLQPAIYRWQERHGLAPLVRRSLLAGVSGGIAAALAALFARPVLGILLDASWTGVASPFAVFCLGSTFQAWASVAAAVLHRMRAGKAILLLELAGGSSMLLAMLFLPNGSPASSGAWCWVLGRGIWAMGGCVVAFAKVRGAMRRKPNPAP